MQCSMLEHASTDQVMKWANQLVARLQNAQSVQRIALQLNHFAKRTIRATALNYFATVRIAYFNEKMDKKQVSIGRASALV